jgi:hypothetical protein
MNSLFEEIDINFDESDDWSFKDIFDGANDLEEIALDFNENNTKTATRSGEGVLAADFRL